ncbi:MAG: hypothetical protein KatS3mg008_1140 [Acidimicrobiales bacterium]|nr:MAG: hypothetical protein KatS3mg008_1140 [Acidimicrobiales bacterium]
MGDVLETRFELRASPREVWDVLTDFEAYPSWNPYVRAVAGELDEGASITLLVTPPDVDEFTVGLKVGKVEQARSIELFHESSSLDIALRRAVIEVEPTDEGTSVLVFRREMELGDRPGPVLGDRGEVALEMLATALEARVRQLR